MTTNLTPTVITAPGVYDIPEAEYHNDPVPGGSLSSSGARALLDVYADKYGGCPAKYHYWRHRKRPSTAAFDFGSAAHKLVLGIGPELVEIDAMDRRKPATREAEERAREAGQIPLLPHEMAQVQDMAAAIHQNDDAMALFKPGTGQPEASLFWEEMAYANGPWTQGTGKVWCRSRFDWLSQHLLPDGRLLIPDYKTARLAEREAFGKAVKEHGYHQQAAFYASAAVGCGLAASVKDVAFLFVVQEKEPPYVVSVVELGEETLMWGRQLNEEALRRYQHCTTTRRWPGYTTGIALVDIPKYASYSYTYMIDDNPEKPRHVRGTTSPADPRKGITP
jgi:hypothetical protein